MKSFKSKLLTSTVIPALVGTGVAMGGWVLGACQPRAANSNKTQSSKNYSKKLPTAKPRLRNIQLAACGPCGAKKCGGCNPCAAKKRCGGCNPCAAKKRCGGCNPCAAKRGCGACGACNPCNPCAGGAAWSSKCVIPRLASACNPCAAKKRCGACNPCAAKKRCGGCNPCAAKRACGGCNPCAAKKRCGGCNPCAAKRGCGPCGGCNPCAAKKRCGGCNPCAAKRGCGPCGACNPCNPCGGAPAVKLSKAEANKAYNCLLPEMTAGYAKAGVKTIKGYKGWSKVSSQPYVSATHGNRFVHNYANKKAAIKYSQYEKLGKMPVGSVLAKDSFAVAPNGKTGPGPMFVMEKMKRGFNKASGNWRYTLIMPNGSVVGVTNGKNSKAVKFCYQCHMAVAGTQDSLMLLPQEFRVKF